MRISVRKCPSSLSVDEADADLVQHSQQEILEEGGDMGPVREAEGVILDYLEKLEDVGGVEGNAAKDKCVQACP